jgi:hypothetical protein
MRSIIFIAVLLLTVAAAHAQDLLNRNISLEINSQRLDNVLEIISNQGNFFFSYNSNIIRKDSLISVKASNKPLKEVLNQILGRGFEYKESGNYIILRRVPIRIKLVTSSSLTSDKFYTISGYVIDDQTGERIADASVYERDRLQIASTNDNGYFRIKLKARYKSANISVSKEYYEDTTVRVQPGYNQAITVTLVPMVINEKTIIVGPKGYTAPESIELEVPVNDSISWRYKYIKADSHIVEKRGIGRWLVSSKQKLQSINLRDFFVARPWQVSFTPGLSTNGKMNSQVINNFSFNVLGGYSGGTNGFELAGLFNIDKKDAQYFQLAGLFNTVGGKVKGLQVGGVSNAVLDTLNGMQVGGVTNLVRTKFSGFQLGGVYNHVGASLDGLQLAGVVNFTNHKTDGGQIAGVANISSREANGLQLAGVFNYTRRLRGVQIGLINVADTSEGYSIGLINIVFKGYHKLSFSTNEIINLNAAVKSGNRNLYSIFLGGYNSVPDERVWSFGYGLGSELVSRKKFSVNLEATCQHLYLGSWDFHNLLNRANVQFNYKFGKFLSVFAGPVYSVYVSNQDVSFSGYKTSIPSSGYKINKLGSTVTGWFGWTAGISFF